MSRRMLRHVVRGMTVGVLKAKVDPLRGVIGWVTMDEHYDYTQEIARSGYGDMLYDKQRNVAYEEGLKSVIGEKLEKEGRADVLDIGTGTGLLSMMAGRAGATSLSAVEAFPPMAAVAQDVTQANGYQVDVHSCRSTDLEDLPAPRPNICVAEVFDTELIGEGALRTFRDALQRLLAPGARVIPSRGEIKVLGVESAFLRAWDRLPPTLHAAHTTLKIPPLYRDCPGNVSIHDIQLDCIPRESFKVLTTPLPSFKFNFEDPDTLVYDEEWGSEVEAVESGRLEALLFWWDLDMDGSGAHIISTQPSFLYPHSQPQPWRDHWLGAICYLDPLDVEKGARLRIRGAHDEFSLWFSAAIADQPPPNQRLERPKCDCGLHLVLSRRHLAWASDTTRYQAILHNLEGEGGRVLCLGEGSLLPAFLADSGHFDHVLALAPEPRLAAFLTHLAQHNHLGLTVLSSLEGIGDEGVTVVVADPVFTASMLPWHNLHLCALLAQIRAHYPRVRVLPSEARLLCVPVKFRDLWKIRAEVGRVEGFDLAAFDRIQQRAIRDTDELVEPQPLWEYPGTCAGPVQSLLTVPLASAHSTSTIPLANGANGVAFWLEWGLGSGEWPSGGLRVAPTLHEELEWEPTAMQGVLLLPPESLRRERLTLTANFSAETCHLQLRFNDI